MPQAARRVGREATALSSDPCDLANPSPVSTALALAYAMNLTEMYISAEKTPHVFSLLRFVTQAVLTTQEAPGYKPTVNGAYS